MSERVFFLKYEPNEKSKQTNRVETAFSFFGFFCLFRILQKMKNDNREQRHVYFSANSTDDEITIYVIPNNDAIPENDETVTITIVNAYANSDDPFSASGSGTVTIKDDDNWTISSNVTDLIALEPCTWIPGNERTGAFEITKSGGQDWTYNIIVKFEMSGTATPRNVGQSGIFEIDEFLTGSV
jgi:hypothetical protein